MSINSLTLLISSEYQWGCLYLNNRLIKRVGLMQMDEISQLVLKYKCPVSVNKIAFRQKGFGEVENLLDLEVAVFNDSQLQYSYERLTDKEVPQSMALDYLTIIQDLNFSFSEAFPSDGYFLRNMTVDSVNNLKGLVQNSLKSDSKINTVIKLSNYLKSHPFPPDFERQLGGLTCGKEMFYHGIRSVPDYKF